MKSNHYTIIISPSDLRPAKKLTLHRSTVLMALFTAVLLVFCGIVGSYKYTEHSNLQYRLERAHRDIAELREANIILLRSKQKERKVRQFLGLDRAVKIPGEPGQGGPRPVGETAEDLVTILPERLIQCSLTPLSTSVFSSVDEALILDDNYQELLDYFRERNKDLAVIPTIAPVASPDAWITSPFGYRRSPFTGEREFHSGIDICAPRGTPILATGDGKVLFSGRKGSLGQAVKIRHGDEYVTMYGHLLETKVKNGQSVNRGDVIGYMGNTGRSTGYHVHYEVWKRGKVENPSNYVLNWKDPQILAERIAAGD